MSTFGIFMVSFVLAMEMVGPSYRAIAGTLCQFFHVFGYFLMDLIAYFVNKNWHLLQIFISAPLTIMFFGSLFFVPESTRWLIQNEKFEKAKHLITTIGKENHVNLIQAWTTSILDDKFKIFIFV